MGLASLTVGARANRAGRGLDALFDPNDRRRHNHHDHPRPARAAHAASGCWSARRSGSAARSCRARRATRWPIPACSASMRAPRWSWCSASRCSASRSPLWLCVARPLGGGGGDGGGLCLVASLGREGATPVKLALAGAAVTAAFGSVTTAVLITNVETLDQFRFWQVGALAGRGTDILCRASRRSSSPASCWRWCRRMLDGAGAGRRRGPRPRPACSAVARHRRARRDLLSWAGTAAAGPIAFVGLTVPHLARAITGPILSLDPALLRRCWRPSCCSAPTSSAACMAPPGELQVGIVTAALGAPFFIPLVRRRKLAEL